MSFWKRLKHLRDVKPVPEEEREKLEKGDYFAMMIAALITLVLPCILILAAIVLVMMFIFRLF